MSDSNLPIKMSSGRRLIITNVTDNASFSARRLSFNAKELRFLSEELAKWLSEMYGEEVDPDLPNSLMSGVVLLTIVEKYLPSLKTVGKWHRNAAPMSFQARDNVRAFANACVELGMRRADVCNFSNFEKGDLKQITATLCAFAKLGIPKGLNKVSENLEQYIENAYSDRLIGMDAVEEEEEIKLTDEEIAELERKREEEEKKRQEEERQRAEEEQRRQEEEERRREEEERKKQEEERIRTIEESLANDVEEGKKAFNEHYHNAVNVLCSDLVAVDVLSVTSSSSASSDEQEMDKPATTESKPRTAVEIQEQISSASDELENALNVLDQLQAKREAAMKEGANVSDVDKTIEELVAKIHELENMISKEEEVCARVAAEEKLRKEEEERLRLEAEEAERKRLEEEEAERKRQEEIEKKRIMEAERLREEAERKRQEEEAERKRQEEEEKKRQEEEEKKRREEEAERVRLELERQHQEEEERIRREEEEAAKKCKGCRNRRSKDSSIDEDDE